VTLTITAEQRDVLYEEIVIRLSGIDGVWLAVKERDFEAARRLTREFSGLLTLLDDLGFGERAGEAVELTAPPDILRRAFERLREIAKSQSAKEERERTEAQKAGAQNELVLETCQSAIASLDASDGKTQGE
jgi:hypothetical protein